MKNLWLFFLVLLPLKNSAQETPRHFYKIGFHYGIGSRTNFLMENTDYFYELKFYKFQLYYEFKKGKVNWEFLVQPEYNIAQHELLNKYFVYTEEEREEFMQLRTIHEYVLNFGIVVRKEINSILSIYALGSIGPGYMDRGTERLAKGIAFSDNLALGLSFEPFPDFMIELRPCYRHLSNANLKRPNSGHDSLNFEFGLSYLLK